MQEQLKQEGSKLTSLGESMLSKFNPKMELLSQDKKLNKCSPKKWEQIVHFQRFLQDKIVDKDIVLLDVGSGVVRTIDN